MSEMADKSTQKRLKMLQPYLRSVRLAIKQHTAPVFWRNERNELRNGTITCISTDSQILGVTAGHVADECMKCYNSDPERTCQIGEARFDPSNMLITSSRSPDIAIFRLSKVYATAAHLETATTRSWPPEAPSTGDLVSFSGYPGSYRHSRDGKIDFDFVSFIGKLESENDRNVGMALNIENSLSTDPKRIPPHANLGGWSGGPVFRIVESPFFYYEVTGIIYEYNQEYEIVLAHPLKLIDEMT